jgi:hypothetical protein
MDEFINKLKILRSIDGCEIEDEAANRNAVFAPENVDRFLKDPMTRFIQMDDAHRKVIWAIVERRHYAGRKYRARAGL